MHELRILHFSVSLNFGSGWEEKEIARLNATCDWWQLFSGLTKKGFALCAQKSRSCRRNLVELYFVGQHCNRRQHAVQCKERGAASCNQVMPLLRFVFSGSRCPAACCCSWCCTMCAECVNTGWQMKCVCVLCVLHVVFVVATLKCGTLREPLGVAAAAMGRLCYRRKVRCDLWERYNSELCAYVPAIQLCAHYLKDLSTYSA